MYNIYTHTSTRMVLYYDARQSKGTTVVLLVAADDDSGDRFIYIALTYSRIGKPFRHLGTCSTSLIVIMNDIIGVCVCALFAHFVCVQKLSVRDIVSAVVCCGSLCVQIFYPIVKRIIPKVLILYGYTLL